MVKSIETVEDLRKFLGRSAWFCFSIFILLFFAGIPFVVVPDLANLKGSTAASLVLQSYIIVYGLMLTVSTATAALSANNAREILASLRQMQPFGERDTRSLGTAIEIAEDLRKDVFRYEAFVMVTSLAGIVMAVLLMVIYGGGPISPIVFFYPLGVLFLAFFSLLQFVSHSVQISVVSLVQPPVPPKPCPKCGGPLTYVKIYQSTFCVACGMYQ